MHVRITTLLTVVAGLAGCAAPATVPITAPPVTSTTAPVAAPIAAPLALPIATPTAAPPATTAMLRPPAPVVATGPSVVLRNPGFEATTTGPRGDPEGWYSYQHAGPLSYRYTSDPTQRKNGERSLHIENIGPEIYGAVAQVVDVRAWNGKVVRLSAWVKTRDANDNGAVLTLLAMQRGATMAQNFMPDAPIKGSNDWKRYVITMELPMGTDRLEVGMMLRGKGSAWLDDVELDIVAP